MRRAVAAVTAGDGLKYAAQVSAANLREFGWGRLPRTTRTELRAAREARGFLREFASGALARSVFQDLFAAGLEGWGATDGVLSVGEEPSLGADVQLVGRGRRVWLSVESGLAATLISRVLGKACGPVQGPLGESLQGAWRAVVAEFARRLSPAEPLEVVRRRDAWEQSWLADFWLRVDGASFRGRVRIELNGAEASQTPDSSESSLPLRLALVRAVEIISREEAVGLEIGDALVFDQPSAERNDGVCWLCAPASTLALSVAGRGGRWSLRGVQELSYEAGAMSEAKANSAAGVEDAILGSGVSVRLELGHVTLAVKDWLALRPGDVLETDVPVGEQVTLRVGERSVAQGSLVDVDGKLGVRITSLTRV